MQLHSACAALLSVPREACKRCSSATRAIRHSREALNTLVRVVPTLNKRAQSSSTPRGTTVPPTPSTQ